MFLNTLIVSGGLLEYNVGWHHITRVFPIVVCVKI